MLDAVDLSNLGTLRMSPGELDRLIVVHGSPGELRPARTCPCVRPDTRTPAIGCKVCRGIGRIYPEHLRMGIVALDIQRNATLKLAQSGAIPKGTIQLTFPSDVVPAMGDLWLPEGEIHAVEEVLVRDGTIRVDESNTRPNRFSPDSVPQARVPRRERLLYDGPCCIVDVAYLKDDGSIVYAQPSQYHIDDEGRWTWRGRSGPPSGRVWTVRYHAPAAYVIGTSVPVYRTEGGVQMPFKAEAQPLYQLAAQDLRDE